MANNANVAQLTFIGTVAGQATVQSQAVAGNLTLMLPNLLPTVNQLMTAQVVQGNVVTLGWVSPSSANGTVTSVAVGNLSPLFTTAVANGSTTPSATFTAVSQAQHTVYAGPVSGSSAAPTFRSLVVADIPSGLPYIAPGGGTFAGAVVFNNNILVNDAILDHASSEGTAGQVLTSTGGAQVAWSSTPTLGAITGLSGTGLGITVSGSDAITLTSAAGTLQMRGNGMSIAVNTATIAIANTGGITVTPASGTVIALGNARFTSALTDGSSGFGSTGTTGQVLSSTGGVSPTTLWIDNPSPVLSDATGTAPASGDNHIASGSATLGAGGTVTITLTGGAVFTSNTTYVVQVTYLGAPSGTGKLYVTRTDGAHFNIVSTVSGDTDNVIWTAIGI